MQEHDRPLKLGRHGMPVAAIVLGVLGLIPFVALPFLSIAKPDLAVPAWLGAHLTIPAMMLYAAVILSFMGGVQWGLAMADDNGSAGTRWRQYGVSVIPALLAWLALFFDTRVGLFLLAVGFVGLLVYDIWTVRRGEAPVWYEALRLFLTSVVVFAISLTLTLAV